MALENGNEMVMPVTPMGGFGGGFGGYGGDATWLIILFLFAMFGGWGNGFGGNGGSQFPWMLANNTDSLVTAGFNQASTTSLLGDIQGAITTGFANAEIARVNSGMNLMQTLNGMQMAQQQCCCDTRASIADLKYTLATEACATRYAEAQNTRDIIDSTNRNGQVILDKLCQLELDAKNDKIAELERELTMANLSASQTAQTAQIIADNTRQTVALEQYLNPVPIPAYIVQNPSCCNQNWTTGCGSY